MIPHGQATDDTVVGGIECEMKLKRMATVLFAENNPMDYA
jgi:hypothetical protein